ncbi:MAG: dTDP-4-dehydrorhamnose reductase [Thermoleophilaceae bacterium]|nr:dTDP-4-dehydrorhamnose reductase [Thermoleophilaceae bacterium]
MSGTLLVTGGSGYLGRELLRRGEATGTYLTGSPPAGGLRLDIRDADAVGAAFESLRPDAVINAAYRADDRATTFDGALAVARAAAAAGARLVQVSTDLVFDGDKGEPYTEQDEPRPLTPYGRAKADAERAVRDAHPGALVVRTSLIYGGAEPGPQERLAADPGATFFTDEVRSPIHAGDLAAALLELVWSRHSGLLHVAGADALSRYEFARLLAPAASPPRSSTVAGSGLARPRNCPLAVDRARELLGTRLRGAREVLEGRRARP